jgi:hypothetical protein
MEKIGIDGSNSNSTSDRGFEDVLCFLLVDIHFS